MTFSATRRRTGSVCSADIHHPTPAFAHALQQLVAPERHAHGFVGCIGEIELNRGPGLSRRLVFRSLEGGSVFTKADKSGLCGQERFRLLVRGEQGFEAGAQGRIASQMASRNAGRFSAGFSKASANRASSRFGFMSGFVSCFYRIMRNPAAKSIKIFYWADDKAGDRLFVVTAEANAGLVKMLPGILEQTRLLVGGSACDGGA